MDCTKYSAVFEEIFPFWLQLTAAEQNKLLRNTVSAAFTKGQLLHGGNQCTGLIAVTDGELRVYMLSEEGREVTLYRLQKGDICMLSASCVLSAITFDVLVKAESDCQCLMVSGKEFSELAESNLLVKNYALEKAVMRFSDVMWVMQQILFTSLDKRLAAFLVEEANRQQSCTLKLTHEQIANNLGTAREVISRLLKYLATEKTVTVQRGTVTILDLDKLKAL